MPPALPTAPKRSACDRCRVQKLRCPPCAEGSSACARCVRLGAQCITSYPRPSNAALLAHPHTQGQSDLRPKDIAMAPVEATTTIPEETFDYYSAAQSVSLASDNLFFLDQSPTPELLGGEIPQYPNDCPADFTSTVEQPRKDSSSQGAYESILECNRRLSGLVLDLSRRLEQCMLHKPRGEKPSLEKSSGSLLLEAALGDLSEFLVIVRSVTPHINRGGGSGDLGSQGSIHFSSSHINILILLHLIAAYFQIVVIYEQIFRSLSSQLFDPSGKIPDKQRVLSGLQLAGLAMGPGTLQTKILIHAILHQFDLLERMLGLPADLRVTDNPGTYMGLFEGERARALLGAVAPDGPPIHNGWSQIHGDENDSSKVLASLRETIKVVRLYLEM
ncbi:hypothetical protein N7456_001969 [Penicillium angulare]|uniref:Zn(2)-C6 fungal-type domain-containing protein n=1 Tax=Penicillium angulare TaxID=116970 RepID=A0A9W9G898_9EURO|nr:hypothetical protein N7456_001969 [Penicillium angulare]